MLTADLATSACGVEFLRELPPERGRRLDRHDGPALASARTAAAQLAAWTETMLGAMLSSRSPIADWDVAYLDIARLFGKSPDALRSRRILLTDAWELQPCASGSVPARRPASREATPFFPPTTQRIDDEDDVDPDADLALPKSLSSRLFYVHGDLTWYVNRQQTPARRFLQDHRLVRSFETRGILEHIRTVLAESRSRRVAEDALRFVFNLSRSGARIKSDLAALGLRVPAADGGWIPAANACSPRNGRERPAKSSPWSPARQPIGQPELHALAARLIAPPSRAHEGERPPAEWVAFLRRIGVGEVIPLNSVRDDRRIYGSHLTRRPSQARQGCRRRSARCGSAAFRRLPACATHTRRTWRPGRCGGCRDKTSGSN